MDDGDGVGGFWPGKKGGTERPAERNIRAGEAKTSKAVEGVGKREVLRSWAADRAREVGELGVGLAGWEGGGLEGDGGRVVAMLLQSKMVFVAMRPAMWFSRGETRDSVRAREVARMPPSCWLCVSLGFASHFLQ